MLTAHATAAAARRRLYFSTWKNADNFSRCSLSTSRTASSLVRGILEDSKGGGGERAPSYAYKYVPVQ